MCSQATAGSARGVALADFLAVLGRVEQSAVTKATMSMRSKLGGALLVDQDVPLLPLDSLGQVLRLLPAYVSQQYRECGDEEKFRKEVMSTLPELLAVEAESWVVTVSPSARTSEQKCTGGRSVAYARAAHAAFLLCALWRCVLWAHCHMPCAPTG
jgi:hypothetical protein